MSWISPLQDPVPAVSATGRTVALIPAFNEERFIGSVVLRVSDSVDDVIVIDDGSRDNTANIAARAGAIVIRKAVNEGKAAAINTGLAYLRPNCPAAVIMLDGDGQHFPEDIPHLLAPIKTGDADMVIGSRFLAIKSDIPAYRKIGQHSLTVVTNLASGVWVTDSQSGFRAFSSRAVQLIHLRQRGFSIESEMQFLAREHNLRLTEIPINVVYAEPAKRNPVVHGMQVISAILRLTGQLRPLLFFGLTGLLTILLGIGLGLYVVTIYQQSQVLAFGYALLTATLAIIGVVLLFAGVMLHSMRGMLTELRLEHEERFSRPTLVTHPVTINRAERIQGKYNGFEPENEHAREYGGLQQVAES